MSDWVQLLALLALVIAFWLFIIRPARKRQAEFADLHDQLEVGQRVMLTSGIFGELVEIGEETIQLRIAPSADVTVVRAAVAKIVTETGSESEVNDAGTDGEV